MRRYMLCGPAALLALWLVSGCGGDNSNPNESGFALAISPTASTVSAGGSATYTVTLTAVNGFSQPVALSASGLPAGAAAAFNPAAITPASAGVASTLTVSTTAGASATPSGTYALTVTGTGGGVTHQAALAITVTGQATKASFIPTQVKVGPDGRIYFGDRLNNRVIRMDDMTGKNLATLNTAGTFAFGPDCIAFDSQGRMYMVEAATHKVFRVDDFTGKNLMAFGTDGYGTGQFSGPYAIFIGAGDRIFVNDHWRVVIMNDMSGTNWQSLPLRTANQMTLSGLYADPGQNIYVMDYVQNQVIRVGNLDPNSVQTLSLDWQSNHGPFGLWVDSTGRILVPDALNKRLVRLNSFSGLSRTTWPSPSPPVYVFVDAAGRIYLSLNSGASGSVVRIDDMSGANEVEFASSP